jgi:hypothetical protein
MILQIALGIILAFSVIAIFLRFGFKPFIITASSVIVLVIAWYAYMNFLNLPYPKQYEIESMLKPVFYIAIVAWLVSMRSQKRSKPSDSEVPRSED